MTTREETVMAGRKTRPSTLGEQPHFAVCRKRARIRQRPTRDRSATKRRNWSLPVSRLIKFRILEFHGMEDDEVVLNLVKCRDGREFYRLCTVQRRGSHRAILGYSRAEERISTDRPFHCIGSFLPPQPSFRRFINGSPSRFFIAAATH
jgi:hypothetical protein